MARKIVSRKFKLSEDRQKYVKNRDTSLVGEPLKINQAFLDRKALEMAKLVDKMDKDVSNELEKLFKSRKVTARAKEIKTDVDEYSYAQDAQSITVSARILMNKLSKKWNSIFSSKGNDWAREMAIDVNDESSKDLSDSMKKLSGGLDIKTDTVSPSTKELLLASSVEAASLMTTISPDYMKEMKESIMRSIKTNESNLDALRKDIHNALQGKYRKYKNKAFNNAKDQIKKTYSNTTAKRMEEIGVTEYIWRHSGGSKEPRPHHKDVLNGKKFKLSEPPIIDPSSGRRGKPADDYNCSCYMQPVISFENK